MHIIQTEALTKTFVGTVAVDHVSLNVRAGEIYGFLGLNGAGKTTTIRLLLGMIRPDSGSFSLFGQRVHQASHIWNDVGYLVETPHAYPELTVRENLEVFHRLRHLQDKTLIGKILDILRLSPYADRKARHLSTGNAQRLGLAKALMHMPKLLILDEPINGLDPAGIVEVRELLKRLVKDHGTTIFLSSHILSEIAKLATRIGIVHEGALLKEVNADDLEHQIIRKLCLDTVDNERALRFLQNHGFPVTRSGDGVIETTDERSILRPEEIATFLVESHMPPRMLRVQEEDLESYFLRLIGKQSGEG